MVGFGFALAAVGVFFRDIRELVQMFVIAAIFLMPIVYLPGSVPGGFDEVIWLNPFTYMVWCYQDVLYFGRIEHPWAWVVFAASASSRSRPATGSSGAAAVLRERAVSEPVIKLGDVSKAYSIYERPRDVVVEALLRRSPTRPLLGASGRLVRRLRGAAHRDHRAERRRQEHAAEADQRQPPPDDRDDRGRGKVSAMLSLTSFLQPERPASTTSASTCC